MSKNLLLTAAGACALVTACSQPTTGDFAPVAYSGKYADLKEAPDLSGYAKGSELSAVARTGVYADLMGTPDLSVYATNESVSESLSSCVKAGSLSPVATSGSYGDLSGRPWTGTSQKISSSAGVTIDAPNAAPLSVVAYNSDYRLDASSDADGTLYPVATSNWQSFTAGATGTLKRLDVNRWWDSPGTGYTLKFYEGEGTNGAAIYTESGLSIADGVHSITLSTPLAVVQGHVYTWELTNATGFRLVGYNWSSYEGGHGSGDSAPGMDFQFSTYVQPNAIAPFHSLTVAPTGEVGIGTATPAAALDVAMGDLRVRTPHSPGSTENCRVGQIAWDENYIYVCVATHTWKRSALSTY